MSTRDVIIQALLRQAAKGNMIAIREIFDRLEGKTLQLIDLDGKLDHSCQIQPFNDSQVDRIIEALRKK